eukprot:jgi/Chlat1/3853/Chrsp26S00301
MDASSIRMQFQQLKVTDLKAELSRRGLKQSGLKAELIERLVDATLAERQNEESQQQSASQASDINHQEQAPAEEPDNDLDNIPHAQLEPMQTAAEVIPQPDAATDRGASEVEATQQQPDASEQQKTEQHAPPDHAAADAAGDGPEQVAQTAQAAEDGPVETVETEAVAAPESAEAASVVPAVERVQGAPVEADAEMQEQPGPVQPAQAEAEHDIDHQQDVHQPAPRPAEEHIEREREPEPVVTPEPEIEPVAAVSDQDDEAEAEGEVARQPDHADQVMQEAAQPSAPKRKLEELAPTTPDEATFIGKKQRRWNSTEGDAAGKGEKAAGPSAQADKPPVRRPDAVKTEAQRPANGAKGSPAVTPRSATAAVEEGAQQARHVPSSTNPVSRALRVDNFVRPLTVPAVKELLSREGTIVEFWMNNIKSHCYVVYETEKQAADTREAVHDLLWPPHGKKLVAEFAKLEDAKQIIASNGTAGAATPRPAAVTNNHARPAATQKPAVKPEQKPPAEPQPPGLDDLFRKTRTKPHIYYLPLTAEQIAKKHASKPQGAAQGHHARAAA